MSLMINTATLNTSNMNANRERGGGGGGRGGRGRERGYSSAMPRQDTNLDSFPLQLTSARLDYPSVRTTRLVTRVSAGYPQPPVFVAEFPRICVQDRGVPARKLAMVLFAFKRPQFIQHDSTVLMTLSLILTGPPRP